ncbi:MAG: VWA domain-containing protein [Lachnospiraceae bacterium]|nr:VWA domain-containing protein [Lachnospiraceae bacterium]
MEFVNIFAADSGIKYKNLLFLYISAGLALVFAILFFVIRRSGKFKKGEKIYAMAYAEDTGYLKKRKAMFRVLSGFLVLFMTTSFLSMGLIFSRPYKEDVKEVQRYSRDIILCMDVSTSVCKVNENLCEELKDMVLQLKGDRFGIIVFNTTPVLFCPLTDDYNYVIEILDQIQDASRKVDDYYYHYKYSSDIAEKIDYLYTGTGETNWRGSSFAGDGLASTVLHFPKMGEEERTRVVIYTSDNDINETDGEQYFDIMEAAELCRQRDILVYGIGTTYVPRQSDLSRPIDVCMNEMKQAVELTGGSYYLENEIDSFKTIVKDIEKLSKNAAQKETYTTEQTHQEMPILFLMASMLGLFVTVKLMKK